MAILMVFNAVLSFLFLLIRGGLSRQTAGGPGDLQIKAAGIGVGIQQFSREIQIFNKLGLHGFGVYLPHLHPAGGDDGILHRTRPGDLHRKML